MINFLLLIEYTNCWELNRSFLFFIAGASLKKFETEKGVIARFVIGRRFGFGLSFFDLSRPAMMVTQYWNLLLKRYFVLCSVNKGDSMDKSIDAENSQTDDFIILVCVF